MVWSYPSNLKYGRIKELPILISGKTWLMLVSHLLVQGPSTIVGLVGFETGGALEARSQGLRGTWPNS